MRKLESLNFENKKVFVRLDMNVPLDENCEITDDNRIRASIQTINFVREAGGKVIACSHLGQPKGKRVESLSLKPIAERLRKLTGAKVTLAPDCVGGEVVALANALEKGEILLLENPRFHAEEEKNDPIFAKQLADLAEVYINDAFAVNHRAHASTVGMSAHFQEKAAGYTLQKEMDFFNRALTEPKQPLVAIFGGAKVSTKMRAIKNVGQRAQCIVVGGAMANTFFVAQGLDVGKSLYEPEQVGEAKEAMSFLADRGCRLVLPVDVVVADALKPGVTTSVVSVSEIPAEKMALDIGPKSLLEIEQALSDAATIVWNGPVGAFETDEFSRGTYGVVELLVKSKALTVVGGGDTDLALHNCHAMEKMGYVSTGGGAFLELLEGRALPGVVALG